MDEDQRKHLDLIQGVINRLAGNSFSVKTWAIGLIATLAAFGGKDANPVFAFAILLPAICFWGLDAYFLHQERLYRVLYNKVVRRDQLAEADRVPLYSLDATACVDNRTSWFASTVASVHVPILLFVIGLLIYAMVKVFAEPSPLKL